MKNKPTRHKETNTFKFQPFSERISHLDIDVFHRIGHKNEEYDGEETFFHQTLQKWNVLNLSESYDQLRKELPSVQTLPLLLVERDVVIEVLLKHLSKQNPLALEAILDLLAALMKDLRHEIYASYGIILQRLCELLSTKDADEMEWTLTCLAYMFKYLWRYIVKDMDSVFDNILPLFSDNKPHYIRNFAAESFAYVARKVKNKKDFVKLILKILESRPDSIEGCGRLMFEVLRGIHGRFHSFAQDFLPLILKMLYDPSVNRQHMYELLKHMVGAMCSFVDPKYFSLFWNATFEVIQSFDQEEESEESQILVLQLLKQSIQYKNCVLLLEPIYFVSNLLKLFKCVEHESISVILSDIVATLLLSPNVHLSQEHARQLIVNVLKLPHETVVLNFICQTLQYSGFETFILPWVQKYVCNQFLNNISSSPLSVMKPLNETVFKVISKIIMEKAPPCMNGIDLKSWIRYPLDLTFSEQDREVCAFETYFLKYHNIERFQVCHFEELFSMLLVLPHVNVTCKENIIKKLKFLMSELSSLVGKVINNREHDEKEIQTIIFLLLLLLEALIHVSDFQDVEEVCSVEFMFDSILPFAKKPVFICALAAIDLYLTAMDLEGRGDFLRSQLMKKLCETLAENLSSPYRKIRLLTTHILSLFHTTDSGNVSSSIKYCFEAESISVSINNVRDKLMLLEKLSFDVIGTSNDYLEIPLRYLLGVLYENFQLIWEPVIHLIATYAQGMVRAGFWKVFFKKLERATQDALSDQSSILCSMLVFSNSALAEIYNKLHCYDDRPDFSNYRILLWKSFAEFPEFCEWKSKDVSPLFLDFIEKEYLKANSPDQFYSVKLPPCIDKDHGNAKVDDSCAVERKSKNDKSKFSQLYQSLFAYMRVFAKLRNPRCIHREAQLKEFYMTLLSHRNSNIQKMALDCLMAYKEKFLVLYKEHLYGLLDDKTFKSEIVRFQIDKEASIVQAEHRAELMPFVIKILYGRMLTKTGRKSVGKGSGDLRRSLVLRFLSGCQNNEMIMFLKLAFKIFTPYLQEDSKGIIEATKSVDLTNIISLKSLKSSLNILLVVIEKFGSLMGNEVLSFVLYVLICIGSLIYSILLHKSEIYAGYASGLRSLQSVAILAAAKFFSQFSDYPWLSEDLDAFFSIFVWPGLQKLPIEGIHSPTALLKLFVSWSQNPRYFNLFVKRSSDSEEPLCAIMKLLAAPKIHPSVTNTILMIIEALLTTANHTEKISEKMEPAQITKDCEEMNYGSKILCPYVPNIIQHLQKKLCSAKKKGLGSRDLLILSRVCELEIDAKTSESLLKLLLLTFVKKVSGSEQTIIHLVTTIYNLLKHVSAPLEYIRSIAPLFGTVSSVGARKMLCGMLTELSERDLEINKQVLLENVQIILDINAWDAKWVEQPDFNRRLDGFKLVYKMIEEETVMLDFGLIIVHNCFYFVKHEKDLALRDSSGYCLRRLSPYLCKKAIINKISQVPESILNLITTGLREKSNETLHDESVALLGELVRDVSDTHRILLDLKGLGCKDDPEVDFFNNIIHLQSHRRARALTRFCSVAKRMTKLPQTQTMTHFILPLVQSFLCSEKYSSRKNVVDAAVQAIGVVCRLLPWFHYETLLKYYLQKLLTVPQFQKQLVRVVISILEAFHFDVSLAKDIHDEKKVSTSNVLAKVTKEIEGDNDQAFKNEFDGEDLMSGAGEEESKSKEDRESRKEKDEIEEDLPPSLEEQLEFAMDISEGETEEIEAKEITKAAEELFVLQHIKLSAFAATKVLRSITRGLLPLLQQTINQQRKAEGVHKLNRKKTAAEQEEQDTMCIPVALAIVKLLQQLPSCFLDQYLPNIFLNICSYLKSRLESVRRVTREILQQIMASLGPSYLEVLLSEMIALLTKGYQIHVLIYTIHSVLSSMRTMFKPGDMDKCLSHILDICKMDLFGRASEEKDVAKITSKVSEARSHKSYDTLCIAAQYITEKCFVDLLVPFKEVLAITNSYSTLVRVSESFHRIVIGLNDNEFVPVESLLMFIYGITSGSIDALQMNNEGKTVKKDNQPFCLKRPDSFLIPEAPRTRYGAITAKPGVSRDRNAHMLSEFGFSLLHILLKRGKADKDEFATFIDPLVPLLQKNIETKHVKLTTTTLQCFVNILKMDLPNVRKNIQDITDSFFNLLHKYATSGPCQDEYFDMIIAAFKSVTVLVRDVKYHIISDLQLKALLLYIERDMENFNRQATAFPLLKAILSRHLDVPEVYEVMNKVARISIVSDHDHVRGQARVVFYHFLMNYPLGNKVDKHINFYISQLRYKLEPGRLSAFQIIHRMIATFPDEALIKYAGILFVSIGAALVNDDSPSCKKMAAKCLKTLITRHETGRDKLFGMTKLWLKDTKIAHCGLGVQILGIFVEVERMKFLRHMKDILPVLRCLLSAKMNFMYAPGKCVKLVEEENVETKEKNLRLEDHCIFQVLHLIRKICSQCPEFLTDSIWMNDVEGIADSAQHLLSHPHEWIRVEAANILGHVFASLDVKALTETVASCSSIEGRYLFNETGTKLKTLVLDLCAQLVPTNRVPQLIEQVTKNLAFLSQVIQALPENAEQLEVDGVKISLLWMIRKMRKIVNMEIVQMPSSFTLREAVFKWIGSIVVHQTRDQLQLIITQILSPLAREMFNEEESHPSLLRLAKGIAKIIKKKLGMEEYSDQLSKVQVYLSRKRALRRKERAQEVVHNPEMAAKRKMKKHQRKKIVKKQKIDEWKGRIAPKRKPKLNKSDSPAKRKKVGFN